MNSFYKKIALICLVSLTANQAAQAFQFSDIANWVRANPKKSFALYIGLCALAATACIFALESRRPARRINHMPARPVQPAPATDRDAELAAALAPEADIQDDRELKEQRARERAAILDREAKRSAHQVAIKEDSDDEADGFVPAHYEYAAYVDKACIACPTESEFNRLTGEYQDVPARTDVRSLDTLSDADHKRLAELSPNPYQPGNSYYPPDGFKESHDYITIARDQNKDIVGFLWYWLGYGDYAHICILNVQGPHAKQIKKELLKPLLHARKHDTTKYDISICGDSLNGALVRKSIQEVDGRIRQDRKASEKDRDVFRRNDPQIDDLFRERITYGGGKNSVKWCNDDETYPKPGQVPSVQYYEDNDLRGLGERRARGRRILEMRRREQPMDVADALVHESFADLHRSGDAVSASQAV